MLPSVTRIINIVKDNDNPVSEAFADRLQALMARAGIRGTAVHNTCLGYAQNIWVPLDDEHKGYFLSFQGWFDKYVEKVFLVEQYLEDRKLGFCGHPDLILLIKGDKRPSLWDLKTPITKMKKWRLQLSGYEKLAEANNIDIGRIGSIRLDPSGGNPKLQEYTTYNEDIVVFLSLLNVYRWWEIK
jgi:hypothetical protein